MQCFLHRNISARRMSVERIVLYPNEITLFEKKLFFPVIPVCENLSGDVFRVICFICRIIIEQFCMFLLFIIVLALFHFILLKRRPRILS